MLVQLHAHRVLLGLTRPQEHHLAWDVVLEHTASQLRHHAQTVLQVPILVLMPQVARIAQVGKHLLLKLQLVIVVALDSILPPAPQYAQIAQLDHLLESLAHPVVHNAAQDNGAHLEHLHALTALLALPTQTVAL